MTDRLIDKIHVPEPSHTHEFTFYTCSGTYSGRIIHVGDDYVTIQLRAADDAGAYKNMLINMKSVCAVKEVYSRE